MKTNVLQCPGRFTGLKLKRHLRNMSGLSALIRGGDQPELLRVLRDKCAPSLQGQMGISWRSCH